MCTLKNPLSSSVTPLSTQHSSMVHRAPQEHGPPDPSHRSSPCQLLQLDTPKTASLRCSPQRHTTLAGISRYHNESLALLITLPIPGVPYLPAALNYCCCIHPCLVGCTQSCLPQNQQTCCGWLYLLQLLACSPLLPLLMLAPQQLLLWAWSIPASGAVG